MSGIGLVLNPRAKQTAKDPTLGVRLTRILGDAGVVRSPETFEELGEVAEDFKRLGIELVAVAGGDGTNHITISGLVEVYKDAKLPYFALLRGGTMNTVANSFGIPAGRPDTLLRRAMRAYQKRAVEPMPFVEPNVLGVGSRYGFIFGAGAIHGFIAEYNARQDRSPIWAAQVLGKAIASSVIGRGTVSRVAQRWEGSVRFGDGSAFPERGYFTVGASTCGQIGLGFKPFYRSGEMPDRFHMLGIHCNTGSFIRGLPNVLRGISLGGDKTYEKVTDFATLFPKGDTVPYQLDGDIYDHHGPLEVRCGPRVRVVVPR